MQPTYYVKHPDGSFSEVPAASVQPESVEADQLIELAGALEVEKVRHVIAQLRAIRFREGPFQAGYETAIDELEVRLGFTETKQAELIDQQPDTGRDAALVECVLCNGHGATHYPDGEWEGKCAACKGTGIAHPANVATQAVSSDAGRDAALKPFSYVVVDEHGNPEFVAANRNNAQEHINDAISEHDIEGAVKWKAVAAYEMRPSDDKLWDETISDRDQYHEWADKLADAIANYFQSDIGEHSNINCPWAEAVRVIEEAPALTTQAAPEVASVPDAGDEPVYWSVTYQGEHTANAFRTKELAQATLERLNTAYPDEDDSREIVPLYTRPQPAPAVLSDEHISEIAENYKFKDHYRSNAEAVKFARAVLAAARANKEA